MTLFELDHAELDLLARIESVYDAANENPGPDQDPDAEAQRLIDAHLETLGEVQEALGGKLAGYVKAIRAKRAKAAMLEAEMGLYQAEYQRLKRQALDEEDTADFLEERLKSFLERRGLTEFEAGTFRLKIVNQGGKLPLLLAPGLTPEQAPASCRKEIPAHYEFNREAIEARLKAGERVTVAIVTDDGEEKEIDLAWYGPRPTKLKIK